MKTLILISALAAIAVASPVNNQKNIDGFISTIKKFPEITRQKKSPAQDVSMTPTNNQNIQDVHHDDQLQTEPEDSTAEGRTVGLRKPIMMKKNFGYRVFRDPNEELTQADQKENCKQQVRVKVCEEENEMTSQNMKTSSTTENDMENSIKLAKEAVENLQKDFVKIENSPDTDLKSEADLHSNIEVARQALEHIHQSFGNLEPMSLKSPKTSDDNGQMKSDEGERLNKWREAIESMKKQNGIFRNIDDAVNSESQHTNSLLTKDIDSNNLKEVNPLEPKTNIKQELTDEFLNNDESMKKEIKNLEKSASNTNENKQDDPMKNQENEHVNSLRESVPDQKEELEKNLKTTASQQHVESEGKIRSALNDHSIKNVMLDTQTKSSEMKTSSDTQPLWNQSNDDKNIQNENLNTDNTNILNDQEFHETTGGVKDSQLSPNDKKLEADNKLKTKSTGFNEDNDEKIKNKESNNIWTKNKMMLHDEATLLKAAAEKLLIKNADDERNEQINEALKMRLSHSDKMENKEINLRMTGTNDDGQSTHKEFNKPMMPVNRENQATTNLLKATELNLGHNSISEQFNMMPNHIMEPMSMDPHTLEDPTFMRWAHERQSNQMPHLHQIPSALHREHLKSSMMDEHAHHMMDVSSFDFPGHGLHDENLISATRLHDHLHGIPQMKSSDMDSAMAPSMYMAMRDSLGRSALDQWKHQGRSSYGSPLPSAASSSGGAIGVFPNANVGGCAIPLLLSCSPNLVSGSLAKPSTPTYSAPAYRSGDDLTYYMKRDTKGNNELPVIKVQRTTTPFNHKNEIVVDRKLL